MVYIVEAIDSFFLRENVIDVTFKYFYVVFTRDFFLFFFSFITNNVLNLFDKCYFFDYVTWNGGFERV